MRVLYLVPLHQHPQTGGELFYVKAFNYLKAQSKIELLVPKETDFKFLNRPENCLGINLHFFNRFRSLPRNTTVIESEHFYYNFFFANWAARICRRDLRFLASVRQIPNPLERSPHTRLVRDRMLQFFLRSAHAVAVNSQYLRRELITKYGVSENRIQVVYSSGQTVGTTAHTHNEKGKLRLLCIGHIRPLKGQRTLIEALRLLQAGSWEMALVGGIKDRAYARELRALIERYRLGDCVKLAGRLEGNELARAYMEADIFVMPSLYEAYGIVAQEAMSFGLPVLASNVGGIPEQVRDGVEGFLVPPGDPVALADGLRRLIVDPELRAGMGERGRQRASKMPAWEQVCKRFYGVLVGSERGNGPF